MKSADPVHRVLARGLRAHGIDTVYGLLGDANLYLVEGFTREEGGRFVAAAHENGAVLAALGHAAVTGNIGVATVTHGPALSNTATALIEGVRGRHPMVLLAGDTAVEQRENPQNLAQMPFVAATGAGFEQLRSSGTAAQDLATAFRRARVERRPIVLNMPGDFMWQPCEAAPLVHPVPAAPYVTPEGPGMDDAIGIIAAARRPLILAGRGACHARDSLVRLAARIGAPLATTLKAKGLFAGEASDIGIFGTLSTPAATEVIAAADCVIALGSGLHHFGTMRGALLQGKRLIQVDADPAAISATLVPDAALVADPGLAAEAMLGWLDLAEIPSSQFSDTLSSAALRDRHPAEPLHPGPGCVDVQTALDALDTALPADRLLVTDGGRFMGEAWKRLSVPDPASFVFSVNFGSVGLGMGLAVGAGCARPGRPVVLVTGDGGFMMGGVAEFNTAVRAGLDLIVIVCNDAAYGAEHVQLRDRQMDPAIATFDWPNFASLATALGGTGVTVAGPEDLTAAEKALNARVRPLLVDIRLDPDAVPRLHL
jgi:acetolactate synthase-1/2/3 large subunit